MDACKFWQIKVLRSCGESTSIVLVSLTCCECSVLQLLWLRKQRRRLINPAARCGAVWSHRRGCDGLCCDPNCSQRPVPRRELVALPRMKQSQCEFQATSEKPWMQTTSLNSMISVRCQLTDLRTSRNLTGMPIGIL